ncbi:MAG: methyltransferase [Candidatus Kariarchaeaceae archaeon]|jgi:HemK-related putative methylase
MDKMIEARGLRINVAHEVYTPREDSFLVIDELQSIEDWDSNFMEIGPGSGIISLSLADPKTTVVCSEISYNAAHQTHENSQHNGYNNIHVVVSDLLSPFRKGALYDRIIFNPPYLPEDPEVDPYSPKYELDQLVGGPKGYETVSRLLSILDPKINKIYTILSSLATNPVDFQKLHQNWKMRVIAAKNMGFETIWLIKVEGL